MHSFSREKMVRIVCAAGNLTSSKAPPQSSQRCRIGLTLSALFFYAHLKNSVLKPLVQQ